MTEREKLIKEMHDLECEKFHDYHTHLHELFADFIIERDKKRAGESVTLEALKSNPIYKHIDIDAEFNKAKQWIARTGGRKLTSRFFVNWLNRIEKPLDGKRVEKEAF